MAVNFPPPLLCFLVTLVYDLMFILILKSFSRTPPDPYALLHQIQGDFCCKVSALCLVQWEFLLSASPAHRASASKMMVPYIDLQVLWASPVTATAGPPKTWAQELLSLLGGSESTSRASRSRLPVFCLPGSLLCTITHHGQSSAATSRAFFGLTLAMI